MQISTRGRYAVMAMAELARRDGAAPITLTDIAASRGLSQCYLEQLFGGLRRAGLVVSARGAGGGYRLSRPAPEITVAAIVEAVDEVLVPTGALPPSGCCTHPLWAELGRRIQGFLGGVTLDDVVARRVGAAPLLDA